jgi:hypothetical protein
MKRLIKQSNGERYFHLTNDKNFNYVQDYENNQQEFGIGLYVTPLTNLRNWDANLRGRQYAIEVFFNKSKIINENDLPSEKQMVDEILKNGYTADDVEQEMPTGNTFGNRPILIATKRFYAKMLGYDGVLPNVDPKEGEQIILFGNGISFGDIYETIDLIKLN